MKTISTSIRISDEDIALLKAQADRRGIKYQTYLKMIIHEEIWKEFREINTMMGKKPKKNPFDKSGKEDKKEAPKKHAAKKTAKKHKKED